jgi:hypothetical protein
MLCDQTVLVGSLKTTEPDARMRETPGPGELQRIRGSAQLHCFVLELYGKTVVKSKHISSSVNGPNFTIVAFGLL